MEDTEETNQESGIDYSSQPVGTLLRTFREQHGFSLEEIYEKTFIPAAHLDDIENSNYEDIPSRGYLIGYLRIYAKLLGLDDEKVVEEFRRFEPDEYKQQHFDMNRTTAITRFASTFKLNPAIVFGSIAAVGVVVILVVIWFLWSDRDLVEDVGLPQESVLPEATGTSLPQQSTTARPISRADDSNEDGENATQSQGRAVSNNVAMSPDQLDDDTLSMREGARDESDVPAASATQSNPVQPGDVSSTDSFLVNTGSRDEIVESDDTDDSSGHLVAQESSEPDPDLIFTIETDSWIIVQDGEGSVLINRLGLSDEVVQVHGEAPYEISLGYAPGVKLEYRGKEIVLDPYTERDIAKLVLQP